MEHNDAVELLNGDQNAFVFDLGTFAGFSFRDQQAIERTLTAQEVVNWNHDKQGEAEFWPSGDKPEVALIFSGRSSVHASEILALHGLLEVLNEDSSLPYLRIHHALAVLGESILTLTTKDLDDQNLHIFEGTNFIDLRREAAFELFELYFPKEYKVWEKSLCDGLIFDEDRFLDSPVWSVEEATLGSRKYLMISPR